MSIYLEDPTGLLAGAGPHIYQAALNDQERSENALRPSYVFRPKLSIEGDQYCALYGENLQDGVAGFGDSPELAYAAFDKAWVSPLTKKGKPL